MNDLEELLRSELRAAADEGPEFVAPSLETAPRRPRRPRRARRGRWPALVAAAAVLVVGGGTAFVALRGAEPIGTADCALVVDWDGRRWTSTWTDRTPVAGAVLGTGVLPGCDDMGQGPGFSEDIEISAIEGVDPDEAVLASGRVLVPEDSPRLPPELAGAQEPVRCELPGTFELAGRWTGVTSPNETRFDGDLRPPYRIDFVTTDQRVTGGYADALLHARGTADSRPLEPAEVQAMLWHEGRERLTTHCQDGRFVVDSLDPAG